VGEVGATVRLEDLALPLVEHRQAKLFHLLVVEPGGLQRLERPLHPHEGRLADLQVEVAALELHERLEEPVDFERRAAAPGGGHRGGRLVRGDNR
jgi:hypothetical protein